MAGGLLNHAQDAAFHLRLNLFADPSHAVPLQSGLDIPLIGAAGSGHATVTVYGVVTPYSGSFKGGIYHAAVHLGLVGSYLSAGPPLCSALVGSVQRAVPSVRTHVKAVAAKR